MHLLVTQNHKTLAFLFFFCYYFIQKNLINFLLLDKLMLIQIIQECYDLYIYLKTITSFSDIARYYYQGH